MFKKYVDVIVMNDKQGQIYPLYLKWNDKTYKIDRYDCVGMRNSHVGGCGILYVCQISGKSRYLFFEKKQRWFVESSLP